jgi:hypothetical protein
VSATCPILSPLHSVPTISSHFLKIPLNIILERGIYMHINNRSSDKTIIDSKPKSYNFAVTYYAISNRHLKMAFYLLMLGYVLAVVCFVTEIMWHRYRSKGRGRKITFFTDRLKYSKLIGLCDINMLLYDTILYDVNNTKQ